MHPRLYYFFLSPNSLIHSQISAFCPYSKKSSAKVRIFSHKSKFYPTKNFFLLDNLHKCKTFTTFALKNKTMRSLRHSYTILLALLTAALAVVSCTRNDSLQLLEQGEVNYKAGTSSNYASHYEESVYYLKQAEEAFLDVDMRSRFIT